MGNACVQGQLALVQVTVSHPSALIEADWVNPWMFEMSYASAVKRLPVSIMRGASMGQRMSGKKEQIRYYDGTTTLPDLKNGTEEPRWG